jgi:hypothetical protein
MLRFLFASTVLFVLAGGAPAFSQSVMFGDKPSFQSGEGVYTVSNDKRAFTINFDKPLEATIGSVADAPNKTPISTRIYSAVIPVAGKYLKTSFFVTGFVLNEPGTNAAVVLSVNGQHAISRFGATKEDQPFLVELKHQAFTPDVRITVMLQAERDSAHPDASSIVRVTAIDTDSALARKRMADRAKKKP